jgi:hypothetical protein
MTEFRTKLEKQNPAFHFSLNSKILTLGSCFSDVLGKYLTDHKIECLANPFGNVYNIQSISEILGCLSGKSKINEDAVVENDGVFFHYGYHSEIRAFSKDELLEKIENLHLKVYEFFKKADYLILTLGTSWIYERIENKAIVSNCHKQKASLFDKKLLPEAQQLDIFRNIYNITKNINPELKILLTVSPVRHTKDTLTLNSVSKSILRVLCHNACLNFSDVLYFPSYEIMMDDLRDYRFYKEDMIHPTQQAEKYILGIFSDAHFSEELKTFVSEWKKIKTAIEHRPFNSKSDKHQRFLANLLTKIQSFENQIDISQEKEIISRQME